MTRAFVKEKEKERLLCLWVELLLEEKSFCWCYYSRKKHNAGTLLCQVCICTCMYELKQLLLSSHNNNSLCWIISLV